MSNYAQRSIIVADIQDRTGIDDRMIRRLVDTFYGTIRRDPVLGPIFADRITDWDEHLERMCAFWSSVVLMSGRYHGQPMAKHAPLPIDARHFDRWLALFEATARKVCPPAAADHFVGRARRIAASLELGIATSRNERPAKDERHIRPDLNCPDGLPTERPHANGDAHGTQR